MAEQNVSLIKYINMTISDVNWQSMQTNVDTSWLKNFLCC